MIIHLLYLRMWSKDVFLKLLHFMISLKLKYQLIQSETMDGNRGPFSYQGTGMGIFYPLWGIFIEPMVSPSGEPSLGPLAIGSPFTCMTSLVAIINIWYNIFHWIPCPSTFKFQELDMNLALPQFHRCHNLFGYSWKATNSPSLVLTAPGTPCCLLPPATALPRRWHPTLPLPAVQGWWMLLRIGDFPPSPGGELLELIR